MLAIGSLGALGITLSAPAVTYIFYFICNEDGCPSSSFLRDPITVFRTSLWPGWSGLFDWEVTKYFFLWYIGLVVMQYVLPGREGEGVVLSDGRRLKYKFNGPSAPPHSS